MTNIIDKRKCGLNTYCSGQNEKNIYNSIRKLEVATFLSLLNFYDAIKKLPVNEIDEIISAVAVIFSQQEK